ncbi:DNA polymerase I [Candidatus Dependentiae bacterium]|nr:DNA polymerase I [Candidatus Dependentiae bacterium]
MKHQAKLAIFSSIFIHLISFTFIIGRESNFIDKIVLQMDTKLQMKDEIKPIYIIDGSSFLYRAYYALRPLTSPQGHPVQAVYGFCRMIKKVIDTFKPEYIVLVWDSKGLTERHEIYENYKSTRDAAPSDLFEQKTFIKEFADIIKLKQLEQTGVEADDLMYSLTKDLPASECILITSDKDMGQMLSDKIKIFDPFKEDYVTATSLEEKYGFEISKLPFYFALVGDASDNIPGVKGIGPKTAQDLVKKFKSLEDLYNNLDKIENPRIRLLLETAKDNAFISEKLFLLRYHKTNLEIKNCEFNPENWILAKDFFQNLNFKSLLKDMPNGEQEKQIVAHSNEYVLVTDEKVLDEMCQKIVQKGICAIDTETNGLSSLTCDLVGISLCCELGTAYYIPVDHKFGKQLEKKYVIEKLKPILEDPKIEKYLHHAKFDQLVLFSAGILLQGITFDTLIAANLIVEEGMKISLKFLSQYFLKQPMLTFAEMVKDKGLEDFSYVQLEDALEYAAADAHQTFALKQLFEKFLEEKNQKILFNEIEMPLLQVLFEMETQGIFVDKDLLGKYKLHVENQIEKTRNEINDLIKDFSGPVNLNSPKQLEELLFVKMQLPVIKKTAGKTSYSTDNEVLLELMKFNAVPGLIIRYRELYKLKSTYIDALLEHINPNTEKIHTSFSQTQVTTGRLSSFDPNLQNIPVDSTLYDVNIRAAFKAEGNNVFISADYSQIELRVLAFLSQDQNLLEAFWAGHDIHARTASGLFDSRLEDVTQKQREIGKRINFSILYGLTPFGLKKDLQISFAEAENFINKYFAQYPGVLSWMEKVVEETKENGFVTTQFGRRRYISGIYEKNRSLYEFAKRAAINTKGQGTAAEIMKIGMLRLNNEFKQNHPEAKILLQIHDELLISCPAEIANIVEQKTKSILENVVNWNVPLKVTTRIGKDWQEVTK